MCRVWIQLPWVMPFPVSSTWREEPLRPQCHTTKAHPGCELCGNSDTSFWPLIPLFHYSYSFSDHLNLFLSLPLLSPFHIQ